ncbi:MAG TPA: hypothetical protein VF630_08285 [Hymenobacter sp.]|jgi:hypothetical protein
MNTQTAYNAWAETYDSAFNKTRDLEADAMHQSAQDNFRFIKSLKGVCRQYGWYS